MLYHTLETVFHPVQVTAKSREGEGAFIIKLFRYVTRDKAWFPRCSSLVACPVTG